MAKGNASPFKPTEPVPETTFARLADANRGIYRYSGSTDNLGTPSTIYNFTKPTDILINRWFPGYWSADITGKHADEAIGWMLASNLATRESADAKSSADNLESFRRLLSTPSIAEGIIGALFPRQTVTAKQGRVFMTEDLIANVIAEQLAKRDAPPAVVTAYTHVIIRVLVGLNMVTSKVERRIANTAPQLAVAVHELERMILMEGLRDVFSEARIAEVAKQIPMDAAPVVIGEELGIMFRNSAHVIPELMLRLEQLQMALTLVGIYLTDPSSLPLSVRAHRSLTMLASIANFADFFFTTQRPILPSAELGEMRAACDEILTLLSSTPSIEQIPLSTYASYFGVVPTASPDGLQRGAVIFRASNQQSRMDVVNSVPVKDGVRLSLMSQAYIPPMTMARDVSNTLLTSDAMMGLAALAADEMFMEEFRFGDAPRLWAINADMDDLFYLAIAKSEIVGVARDQVRGSVLFGVRVSDKWRMQVPSANPGLVYFEKPDDVILYTTGTDATMPASIPARPQGLDVSPLTDVIYVGADLEGLLNRGVESQFTFGINVRIPGQTEDLMLRLAITPLGVLVGYSEHAPNRGTAHYCTVREPGVDADVKQVLEIACAYAELTDPRARVLRDKAQSWLIETLQPLLTHPAVLRLAERAMVQAIKDAGLDGRTLGSQWREISTRLLYGTTLGILARFGKIDNDLANRLLAAMPIAALSARASLALATTPTQPNAQLLTD